MRDLRRQALESGKTISRKARSRIASGATSRANSAVNSPAQSRAQSRNPSRVNSDDDDEYNSDDGACSSTSIDDILNGEEVDLAEGAWKTELHNQIEKIVDRKRSSTEGRAESLNAYARILMARYAKDNIEGRMGEVLPMMLKSIKQETSEQETVNAIKALAVTIITLDSDNIYDSVADQLQITISQSESIRAKSYAIHALGVAAFFGGASEEEMEEIMAFLLEIIESDGLSVEAHDDPTVVTAALENWGLLATEIFDMSEASEAAIESFVDQLESADAGVQIAAGENIALLYEKSHTPLEANEDISQVEVYHDSEGDADVERKRDGPTIVKRYTVYQKHKQLLRTLDELASIADRRISKKDKRALHSSFADIRYTVENPTRGPQYSSAFDMETGMHYGSRMKIRINRDVSIRINKWEQLHRLNALKRVLQGGFNHQYNENEAVSRCLPFSFSGKWRK